MADNRPVTDRDKIEEVRKNRGGTWESHKLSHVPEHKVWMGMLSRCHNPNHTSYDKYGGRGIAVCNEWHSFSAFYADMGPRPSNKHQLDRIDNDKDYCLDNCRWATWSEQQRNKSNTRWFTFNGETKSAAEWAEITGIHSATIRSRIDTNGWSVEKALTTPPREWRGGGGRSKKVSSEN